jgi:ubiquinone/menaquinone biosynthesis C-methylase UbiE
MMMLERQPFAIADEASRKQKARKIVTILRGHTELTGRRVLDVGAGAGLISRELAHAVGPTGSVTAADRVATDVGEASVNFVKVEDAHLPFASHEFDIAISNHVIEHVGGSPSI